MLKKLIHRISHRHHPWRHMKFDELAEVYTSMSLRSLGFSVIGVFVPLFLYQEGVSIEGIFLLYGLFFLLRVPVAFFAGAMVGRVGPKHTIAVSTIILIAFLGMLQSYPSFRWPLATLAFVFTLANGLFFVALNTDFSKVQHKKHGGKELSWLNIFERVGSTVGPFIGGLVASFIAPQATIYLAIGVFVGSLIPLFMTKEPVRTHQKLSYADFSQRPYVRNYAALSTFNVVNVSNGAYWPFLVGIFIFADANTYAKVGALVALSMAISIISARMFGAFIDAKKGGSLLRYGVFMSIFLNISRSLVTGSGGAVAATTLGEPISLSYKMPIIKGYYDEADSARGHRIVYLVWGEVWTGLAKALATFCLLLATIWFSALSVLRYHFIVIAFVGLFMLVHRYKALERV